MERILGRFTPQIYALMRIVAGVLFACHGAQKIFGVIGGTKVDYASMMGAAGFIELVAGLLIAIGFSPVTPRSSRAARWPPRTTWLTCRKAGRPSERR